MLARTRSGPLPAVESLATTSHRPILTILLAASLAEFLLLRLFSRLGIYMPKAGVMAYIYETLTALGSFAFNLASVLVLLYLLLTLVVPSALHRQSKLSLAQAIAALTLVTSSVILAFLSPDPGISAAYSGLFLLMALLLVAPYLVANQVSLWQKAALASILAVYLLSQYYSVSHALYQIRGLSDYPPSAREVLALGELLIIINSLIVFRAYAWPRSSIWLPAITKAWLPPTLLTALFTIVYLANPPVTAVLALWGTGISLVFPWPLYSIAVWLFSYAVFKAFARDETRRVAYGLALLFLAGYMFQVTYQSLLTLGALVTLTKQESNQ